MLDTFYLQIESREASSSRVIELPPSSIRVGRSLHCDVPLSDASLADVECVLRLRGETWYVQPLGARSRVSIDGKPVHHLRILPPGVTLHVGTDRLTIRLTPRTQPEIGTFDEPIPVGPANCPEPADLETEPREPATRSPYRWRRRPSKLAPPESLAPAVSTVLEDWARHSRRTESDRGLRESEIDQPGASSVDDDPSPTRHDHQEVPTTSDITTYESLAVAPGCDEVVRSESTDPGTSDDHFSANTVIASDAPCFDPIEEEDLPVSEFHVPAPAKALAAPASWQETPQQPSVEQAQETSTEEDLPDLEDLEWPSARVILAAAEASRGRTAQRDRQKPSRPHAQLPLPTPGAEPRNWSIPARWAVVPVSLVMLVGTAAGLHLSWIWGNDAQEAGVIANRLLRADQDVDNDAASAVVSTDASWWRTTANHLAFKAAALGTSQSGDPAMGEPIPFLLDAARQASPLEPSARLARVQHGNAESDTLATLGMSRETVNLTVTARRLARDGKLEPALRAYRTALDLAARAPIDSSDRTVFLKDLSPGRFALPNEEMILGVVRDMASQPDWTFETWADALSDHPLVLLATYRVLHERNRPEAEEILDRLVAAPVSDRPAVHDLELAARAEGLALRSRHSEAIELYREAIAGLALEPVKRTWWFNLAEILAANGESSTVKDAFESARAGRGDDTIGRVVGQAMAREGRGLQPADSLQRLRAN